MMNQIWNDIFNQKGKSTKKEIKALFRDLGFCKTFLIFHVVGTNGKGSTATFLARGLRAKFTRVGLFQSPHLIVPNERIAFNGQAISDQDFLELYYKVVHAQAKLNLKLNFFSLFYVVAMLFFAKQHCQIVILEAGIGGGHDVTKTIGGDYGTITSLSYDHQEILGSTLTEIATDKAQIMHPHMRFFLPLTIYNMRDIFKIQAKQVGAQLVMIDNQAQTYQTQNFLLAKIILKISFGITLKKQQSLPGRTSIIKQNNLLAILDVAHNYAGFKATLKLLKTQNIRFQQIVLMIKRTKDISQIKPLLNGYQVYVWTLNKAFYDAQDFNAQPINNLASFWAKQAYNTLYIGSFKLIGALYELQTT